MSTQNRSLKPYPPANVVLVDTSTFTAYDTDAQAFLTAASITDTTIGDAVNQLVIDLKAASIWTKFKAIYPFVGGTSTKHSFNLKNPAAFQITWHGGVTHNANGITGDGSSGYGDTGLNGSSQSLNNDSHLSVYSRTNIQETTADIGAYDGFSAFWAVLSRRGNVTPNEFFVGSYRFTTDGFISATNTDSRGLFMETRVSSSAANSWKNGVSQGSTTTTTQSIPSANVLIASYSTSTGFSTKNIALASIGQGLTSTQVGNFYTAVQTFQTALGRQV